MREASGIPQSMDLYDSSFNRDYTAKTKYPKQFSHCIILRSEKDRQNVDIIEDISGHREALNLPQIVHQT